MTKVWIDILEVQTGRVRTIEDELVDADDPRELNPWYWTDGNASCDCNRELYFLRACGEDEDEGEVRCGSTRYRVNIRLKTGEYLHIEFYPSDGFHILVGACQLL